MNYGIGGVRVLFKLGGLVCDIFVPYFAGFTIWAGQCAYFWNFVVGVQYRSSYYFILQPLSGRECIME